MKKVVCREDISAEMEMFEQMRAEIIDLKQRIHRMQIDLDNLKYAHYKDVGVPTINTPHEPYGESIADIASISDMRRIAIDAMHETAIREGMTEVPDIITGVTRDENGNVSLTWSSNSNTN